MIDGPIVITGAGGFVCSALAQACAEKGYDVVAVDRGFDGPSPHRRIRQVQAELGLALDLPGIGTPSAFVHGAALTAEPGTLGLTAAEHLQRNLGVHMACMNWARDRGVDRFLFLSSMGVFAPFDGVGLEKVTENVPAHGLGAYQAAKQAGEIVTKVVREAGFATLSLRLGNIFGPAERERPSRPWMSLVGRMIREARSTGKVHPGTGDNLREWAWLPDLADAIADLLPTVPELDGGVLHAGTPPVLSDRVLAEVIAAGIAGATVTDEVRGEAPRPPMASARNSVFDKVDWLPIEEGVARLLKEEVPA
ncbi:NAD-dependent epimerase/dehydratase family protein [Halovulum sp. GXIMD14794]